MTAAVALTLMVAGCGGGGGDAGTSVFAPAGGASAPTGPISTVSSGVPNQRFMSISAETYNLDWSIDGIRTDVTIYVADSAGNPVATGTTIQFSTEGGQIQTSCTVTASTASNGQPITGCSVTFNTQDFRPLDGFARIIAWTRGEEAFTDLNANGRHDAGEPFVDSGAVFRDDNENGAYDAGIDELTVAIASGAQPGIGSAACAPAPNTVPINQAPQSVPNTCDGAWGPTLIRRTIVFPLSNSSFLFTDLSGPDLIVGSTTFNGVDVAAPAGTTLSVQTQPANCTVSFSPATVGNAEILPTRHGINAVGTGCTGSTVQIVATFQGGSSSPRAYTIP